MQECTHRKEPNALVPVDKPVVFGETKSVGGGQAGDVSVEIVRPEVYRTSDRGGNQAFVADPSASAELPDGAFVQIRNFVARKPDRLGVRHFASSRRVLR